MIPYFSIIVPTYNVEKYLDRCLESIKSQSYDNWEAICVNDGSQDHSLEILNKYAEIDKRFKVISQQNQGLAETRNVGIRAANGEWLLFIDSDDFIRSDTLEVLNENIKDSNLDAISFETDILYEGNSREKDNKDSWYYKHHTYPGVVKGERLFEAMMKNDEYCDSACLLSVRRKWIIDNNLFFYKGILYEDSIFSMKVFMNALQMRHISEKLYTYRVRESSIMTSGFTNENIRSRIVVFRELMMLIQKKDFDEEVKRQFYRYVKLVADHIKRMDKMCADSEQLQLDSTDDFIARILNVCSYKNNINTNVVLNGIETIVKSTDNVALYGAGKVGTLMLYFLTSCNLKNKISCFIVSKMNKQDEKIQDIPVVSLDEYNDKESTVLVCVMDYAAKEDIVNNLEKKGITNYELCDDSIFFALEKFAVNVED